LFIENFLEVPLSLEVELFDFLRVVNFLGINFLISDDDTLPDSLISFLEVELKKFAVLDTPERILDLNFLAELTLKEGFFALKTTRDMLSLNLHI
jgi:hypothetical protein